MIVTWCRVHAMLALAVGEIKIPLISLLNWCKHGMWVLVSNWSLGTLKWRVSLESLWIKRLIQERMSCNWAYSLKGHQKSRSTMWKAKLHIIKTRFLLRTSGRTFTFCNVSAECFAEHFSRKCNPSIHSPLDYIQMFDTSVNCSASPLLPS